MAKTFNQLMGEVNSGTEAATGQPATEAEGSNLFTNVFGADGAGALYTPADQTQAEFDASPEGQTLERLSDQLKTGGNRFARDTWFRLRAQGEERLQNARKQMEEAQAGLDAWKPLNEMTPEELSRPSQQPPRNVLQQNLQRAQQAMEQAEAQNREMELNIAENAEHAEFLEANTGVSPATKKFFDPNSTAKDMMQAAGEDGFGMLGDLLAQNAPSLGGNVAAGALTGGSSLPVKIGAQSLWEGNVVSMQEFADKLIAESGEDIDFKDPEVTRKIFENRDALEKAYDASVKGGVVGAAGGALSTFLAMKGIIPLSKLASKPVQKTAEVGAQVVAQGTVGAGTEAGIAAAADRELTTGELVAGGILGVASGTIDAMTSRNPEAEAAQSDADLSADPADTAPTSDKLNSNLDAIYGDSDRAISEMDIPSARRDEARSAYEQAAQDPTVSPEDVDTLRTAAIVEQQDYDAEVAGAQTAPRVEDIEQVAKSTPADDPQVKAYREQRDGPQSEFDVPESDPRRQAAEDYKGEENLILRDVNRARFNNPEVQDGGQSGNSPEVRKGVMQDLRIDEGRLERQPGDSGRNGEVQLEEGQIAQDFDEVQSRGQEQQPSDQTDATQVVLEEGQAADGANSPPQDSVADFNKMIAGKLDESKVKERQAVSDEVDRLVYESKGNVTGLNTIDDLPDGSLKDQMRVLSEKSTVRGVFDPDSGRMYVFRENLSSPQEARDITLHEASHAIRRAEGNESARADMEELHEMLGGRQGVLDYAKSKGLNLDDYDSRYEGKDNAAYLMTDELVATIHGNESGPRKQIARRILSKLENTIRDFTGKEVDLFKRTGGRDVVDASVMRNIAQAERSMRNQRIIGSKYGILAAPKELVATDVVPWSKPDWMPNVIGKMADTNRGIRGSEWWRKKIRTDRGLGTEGFRAVVAKDSALRDSNIKVHDKLSRLEEATKGVTKGNRKALSKRMAQYLQNTKDDGSGIPSDALDILDGMRADVDAGSVTIHDVVLTDQLRSKVWKLNQKDPAKYNPEGEDSLVTRIENWKKRPADRDDPEKEDYFKLIPPVIKRHIALMEKIEDNVGSYLRRAYRAHSDATYRNSVLDDPNKVETYAGWLVEMDRENSKEASMLRSAERHMAKVDSRKGSQQKTIDQAQARLAKAQKALDDRPDMDMKTARALLSQMLEKAQGIESANMVSGGNIMKINRDSFKAQTLEDTRMRKILGEYDDVETVYAQSVNTVDSIVANHQMQKSMAQSLQKMGLISQEISRDKIAKDPIEKPMMDGEPMAVLNGFYTTPVVDAAVKTAVNGFQLSSNKILASLVKSSAAVNYGKTILSPPTHVGNYVSNYFIRAANGHMLSKGLGAEHKFMKDLLLDKTPEAVAEYRKMTRLGVASETVDINELADILGNSKSETRQRLEAWMNDPEVVTMNDVASTIDATKYAGKKLGKLKNIVESLYGAEDDLFKIAAFRRERNLAEKYKGLKGAEADEWAAQRVRDGYLMYGELNQLVKDIKNAPGVGVFVSFPAALIKAAKGQIRLAAADLIDEDLPSAVRVQRTIGLAGAYGATTAMAAASGIMAGIGSDEEDEWRQTLPPWAQQNDILFIGREDNGDPRYIDISRLDPFSYFEVGVRELLKSNDDTFLGVNTNLYDMAWSYASPFVGLNIMTGALVEGVTGVDLTTKTRVTNPALSNEAQGVDRVQDFAKAVMPGFAAQGLNIFDAAVNDKKWYGSDNSLGKAAMKVFGVNIGRMDRDVSFRFFASGMKRELGNAASIVSREMGDMSNDADYGDIKDALYARRTAEMKNYKDAVKMIDVMRELDLDDTKLHSLLKTYRFSGKVIENLMAGELPTPKVSGREGSTAYKTALALADSPEERAEVEAERERRMGFLRRAQEEWLQSDELQDLVQ